MLSFDTNLLFYAVDPLAGQKYDKAVDILSLLDPLRTIVTVQVLGELCFSVKRKRPELLKSAHLVVEELTRTFDVVAAHKLDIHEALRAQQQHGFQFWDAMLWAAVQRTGCNVLLTEDFQDNRTLGSVTFRNPFVMPMAELEELLG